jgi:tetratricopeptide (TPR) repeat protein
MSDSSPGAETWIDRIATEFDRAWYEGRRPRIEDYLGEASDAGRPLLTELLRIELQHRKRLGESPTAAEYERRFADHAEAVHAAFRAECLPTGPPGGPRAAVVQGPAQDATLTYMCRMPDGRVEPPVGPAGHAALRTIFPPGTILQDRYVIESELGRGGMGLVYRGRDRRLGDRPVAIKVILPSPDSSTEGEARAKEAFEEEARLGANLVHPAIATVYDFGLHDKVSFTVFEYLPGESLRELLLRRGRLPLDEVRLVIAPIAQALDFAHSNHVVHRDLKPENLRATAQAQFKILDLGLAKEFRRPVDWAGFCGTPAYASPEQVTGSPCDGRTDQYALALVVFEMLTGRRVFEDRDWKRLLEKHRSHEPPLSHGVASDLPEAVLAALARALQKDPSRRFATCEEFVVALGCQVLREVVTRPTFLLNTIAQEEDFGLRRMVLDTFEHLASALGFRVQPQMVLDTFEHLASALGFRVQPGAGYWRAVFLGLTEDALWSVRRSKIMRWPLESVDRIDRIGGEMLSISFFGCKHNVIKIFWFMEINECRAWYDQVLDLSKKRPPAPPVPLRRAEVEPTLLLQQRLYERYQLLGQLEAKRRNRRQGRDEIRLMGTVLGADAVIEVREERLPDFHRSISRISGTAIRAVDQSGRLGLKSRWLADQVARLTLWMVVLIAVCAGFIVLAPMLLIASSRGADAQVRMGASSRLVYDVALPVLLMHSWPLLLAVLLRWLQWPQLMRPAGIAAVALAGHSLARPIGALVAGAQYGKERWSVALEQSVLVLDPSNLIVLFVGIFVGHRIWKVYRDYRRLAAEGELSVSTARSVLSSLTLTGSLIFGLLVLGSQAWLGYHMTSISPSGGIMGLVQVDKDHRIAMEYMNRGTADMVNHPEEAVQALRKALSIWEALSAASPDLDYKFHLAVTYQALGLLLAKSGQFHEAEEDSLRSLAHWTKLATDYPSESRYRKGEANAKVQVALVRLSVLALEAKNYSLAGLYQMAVQTYRNAVELSSKLAADFPELEGIDLRRGLAASSLNSLAWLLATCPDERIRNPLEAVQVGKSATALKPLDGHYWGTLGTAYYRAGDWEASIAAFDKALSLLQGGDSFEWFFLAMAHWQQGRERLARQWYDRAVEWMEKSKPQDVELQCFRDEAAHLLGSPVPPGPSGLGSRD